MTAVTTLKPSPGAISRNTFGTKQQTEKSVSVVDEKRSFACYICETKYASVTFSQESDLKRHLALAHELKNPLQCAYCPVIFSQKRYSSINTVFEFFLCH